MAQCGGGCPQKQSAAASTDATPDPAPWHRWPRGDLFAAAAVSNDAAPRSAALATARETPQAATGFAGRGRLVPANVAAPELETGVGAATARGTGRLCCCVCGRRRPSGAPLRGRQADSDDAAPPGATAGPRGTKSPPDMKGSAQGGGPTGLAAPVASCPAGAPATGSSEGAGAAESSSLPSPTSACAPGLCRRRDRQRPTSPSLGHAAAEDRSKPGLQRASRLIGR